MRRTHALITLSLLSGGGLAHVGGSAAPPRDVATATEYKVARGDTLARIARRLRVEMHTLAAANRIANVHRIRAGDVLAVPRAGATPARPGATSVAAPAPLSTKRVVVGESGRSYVVTKGDNLTRLARRFGTSVSDLASTNGVDPRKVLRIGTRLTIPGGDPWLCPVQGRTDFGDGWGAPRPPARLHTGVDMFAHRGTPVVAPIGGTVRHASGSIAGNAFYLRGDDGHVYYGAHLDSLAPHGRVERGAVVGTVGDTGNARGTTPHLHFEIHLGGTERVNPYPTVERWC